MILDFFKRLTGQNRPDFAAMIRDGAKVVDVRTPGEFSSGHMKGSINIPLDKLPHQLSGLKKDEVIIVCCRSGMRSANARSILKGKGYIHVYNAGPWTNLKNL